MLKTGLTLTLGMATIFVGGIALGAAAGPEIIKVLASNPRGLLDLSLVLMVAGLHTTIYAATSR